MVAKESEPQLAVLTGGAVKNVKYVAAMGVGVVAAVGIYRWLQQVKRYGLRRFPDPQGLHKVHK